MKKQVFGMIAALIALTVMLLTGAYAAEAPAKAERAAPDADAETETAELSAENIAYAILYEDGTLVFQTSETPESGRAVKKTYEVDLTAVYYDYDVSEVTTPWYNERESVRVADFAEKISPISTEYWFNNCSKLERVDNIRNLDTANVTDMGAMFSYCSGLTALDLSHFNTTNVTNMGYMFYGCSGLTALDLSHFDTSNVTNMSEMFYGCSALTALDLSHFNTTNVKYVGYMFSKCSGLTVLDLSHFDTSNVTNMNWMFSNCSGLTALDLSHFNTANVEYMCGTFRGCSALTLLDLSHFDTSNVMDMGYMFDGCSSLTVLDLSHFDTSNVMDMGWMFNICSNLETIFASDKFITMSLVDNHAMFYNCKSLIGGNGTMYNERHTDKEYARIDTADAKGYFTYKAAPAPVKYAIADAVIKDGTLSVTLTNPDAATVAVPYFDANGKFISLQSRDVPANAGTVTLALSADAKTFCVMLCDTDWRPLCRFAADIQ